MNRWFFFNLILISIALWRLIQKGYFYYYQTTITFGLISLGFVLFNWTRHAMFSTIRETSNRQRKIKYAQISKRFVHIHKYTGSLALFFVVIHGSISLTTYEFSTFQFKILFGIVAGIALTAVVTAGWLRHFRPTLRKRFWHLYLAMTMVFLVLIHLLF